MTEDGLEAHVEALRDVSADQWDKDTLEKLLVQNAPQIKLKLPVDE